MVLAHQEEVDGVEARVLQCRLDAVGLAVVTGVDEQAAAGRRDDQSGVTLGDVEEVDLEGAALGVRGREAEKTNDQEAGG